MIRRYRQRRGPGRTQSRLHTFIQSAPAAPSSTEIDSIRDSRAAAGSVRLDRSTSGGIRKSANGFQPCQTSERFFFCQKENLAGLILVIQTVLFNTPVRYPITTAVQP